LTTALPGRTDAFLAGLPEDPRRRGPSSINKNIRVDVPIVGDAGQVMAGHAADLAEGGRAGTGKERDAEVVGADRALAGSQVAGLQARRSGDHAAIRRAAALRADKGRDTYITTEVGQHQMWAAQFYGFEEPNRWMTSGGLGTMGYGLPAALGVQVAHPDSLVIDIAGTRPC
jgi:acetolactate synthase-1/2/3 large subunit